MLSSLVVPALCLPFMAGLFGLSKTKTKTPMNLLYGAIYQSDVPAAKSALDNGADPNGGSAEKGDYGYKHNTPLAVACATKNPEIIRLLIKRGAEVNARSGALAGVTPLEVAVAPSVEEQAGTANPATVEAAVRGRLAAVKLLLDNGADPKIKSRLGSNALTAAAGCGPVEIVELLIRKGAPVNGSTALDQPLAEAARLRKPVAAKIIEALISHGAKPQTPIPPNMETALHVAAGRGHTDSVRVLLDHGAKTEARDRFGATPLHAAVASNRLDTVTLLLERHASAVAEDLNGRTPVMLGKSEEMKALFKDAKK